MSGRRERRNGGDDDIDDGSWTHVSQHDQMLSHSVGLCGVTDTERTILSAVNRLALDPDVESDAMVSCAADERSCGQSVSQTGSRLNPSVRTKDDISSGLQETLSTTDSMYYVGTAGGGRSTAGETVMLTSRGSAGNWNSSFVLPVDDQRRTSNKRQSSQLHADTSPQTEVSGGHSAVGGLIRENVKLREVNKRQAEKIVQLTTELTGARSVPRSSEERSMELHLLNEQHIIRATLNRAIDQHSKCHSDLSTEMLNPVSIGGCS